MADKLPIGAIRRLLDWAKEEDAQIYKVLADLDRLKDMIAIEQFLQKAESYTGPFELVEIPEEEHAAPPPPVVQIHHPGPDYKNELKTMPGWMRNYYFTGHPKKVGNPEFIGVPWETRVKKFHYEHMKELDQSGKRYIHRLFVMIDFNRFRSKI